MKRRSWPAILAGSAGLVLLAVWGAGWIGNARFHASFSPRNLENQLEKAATARLVAAGFTQIDLRMDGQKAIVSGVIQREADRARIHKLALSSTPFLWRGGGEITGGVTKIVDHLTLDPSLLSASEALGAPEPVEAPAQSAARQAQIDQAIANCQQRLETVLAGQTIRFAIDDARIAAQSLPLLQKLAQTAMPCEAFTIEIIGHTDAQGSASHNEALSLRRAGAVQDYLIAQGLSRDRLRALGLGDRKPIADNRSARGREKNRRIEFVVKETVADRKP